jgi:hypothetical protein
VSVDPAQTEARLAFISWAAQTDEFPAIRENNREIFIAGQQLMAKSLDIHEIGGPVARKTAVEQGIASA